MTALRATPIGLFLLCCACSRPEPAAESAETSTSGPSESDTSGEEGTPIIPDMPPPAECTTEWDCGVGERCVEQSCVCMMGCGCSLGASEQPDTVEEPDIVETLPVELGQRPEPECGDDMDCDPLEYCDPESGYMCVETTDCVEDIECLEDWPEEHRFCIDGLCKPLDCTSDADCPDTALCQGECEWIEVLPDCADVPVFEQGSAGTLLLPETASVLVVDLDADGRDDLALLDDGAVYWVMSTGVGFDAPSAWPVEPGVLPVGLGRADIHGDGVDELLVGYAGEVGVEILELGEAGPQLLQFVATSAEPHIPSAVDLDFDGLPDLVVAMTAEGATTLMEAQLGDGTGTFGPLWADDVNPFTWVGPTDVYEMTCARMLVSNQPDFLGVRRFDYQGEQGVYYEVFDRPIMGQMLFGETPAHPSGIVATAAHADRGLLQIHQRPSTRQFVELSPAPDEVVLANLHGQAHHAIIDRGAELAEFVEFTGNPLTPACRGSFDFALDAEQLGVGDFDGDGRADLLERRIDGTLNVWYSRD